jgi:hypothetical protein
VFYWPNLELTEYEKQFARLYKTPSGIPGVLRRAYRVILNSLPDANIPGLEAAHTSGRVQISRRSRVFALSFAGDTSLWRLSIETASGERYTGVNPGAPQTPSTFPNANTSKAPIVAAMCAGSFYSPLSAMGAPPSEIGEPDVSSFPVVTEFRLPLIIEPNWELVPNETLIFDGVPIVDTQAVLEIAVHVWEFPKWEEC